MSDLRVWVLPDDFPMTWKTWLEENGGREIVLRRTFLFKKPVGADLFDGATLVEAWMEAEEA